MKTKLVLCVAVIALSSCVQRVSPQRFSQQQQVPVGLLNQQVQQPNATNRQQLPPGAIPAADGNGYWTQVQNSSIKRHTVQMGNQSLHLNDAELAEFQKKHGQPSSFKEGPKIYIGPNGERLIASPQ